jgi:hypothetical protein
LFKTRNIALAKQALCKEAKNDDKEKRYKIENDVNIDNPTIIGKSQKIQKELHTRHLLLQNEVADHLFLVPTLLSGNAYILHIPIPPPQTKTKAKLQ